MISGGYAGNILRVDLSAGRIDRIPTDTYADRFLGGRGIASRIYWEEVTPKIDARDPDNRLIFITGPVCGIAGFASRFQVCGKSIPANCFSYCNIGGSWGAYLRYSGYDGLVVHGKASRPVYLRINSGAAEIVDASHLEGRRAFAREKTLKQELGESVRVLTVGPAGDNAVSFATFLAAEDSVGSGGLAGVMGSKNLRAIAVSGDSKVHPAYPDRLGQLRPRLNRLTSGQNKWLLAMGSLLTDTGLKITHCHGCPSGCVRATYTNPEGDERKFMCQAALFYDVRAKRYYGGDTSVSREAVEICDDYGLNTRAVETMIMWLSRCHKTGVLSDEGAGLPLSQIGSREFIESLARLISYREGFGDILAQGTHRAADILGDDARGLIKDYMTRTGENELYGARLYIATGIFWAMEPRLPIQQLHEISLPALLWTARHMGIEEIPATSKVMRAAASRFFGSELAFDFSTYEAKALAASRIQDREYAKESLIMCDFSWPVFFDQDAADHVGDPSLDSQICAAVTGREMDEAGLYRVGERVLNLQRAILAREGHRGREHDRIDEYNFTTPLKGDFGNPECLVPGRDGEALSRKGMVVDREQWELLKDEYYDLRGWDVATGLQTRAKLEELDLNDVADTLEGQGLLR